MDSNEGLPYKSKGIRLVMAPPDPRLSLSAYFQPVLDAHIVNKVSGFEILLDDKLPLGQWEGIFKVLELEYLNLLMIYPDGIKNPREKKKRPLIPTYIWAQKTQRPQRWPLRWYMNTWLGGFTRDIRTTTPRSFP